MEPARDDDIDVVENHDALPLRPSSVVRSCGKRKKKARYSKAQKRKLKEQKEEQSKEKKLAGETRGQQDMQQPKQKQKKAKNKKKLSILQRLQKCAKDDTSHTSSVIWGDMDTKSLSTPQSELEIVTGCDLNALKERHPNAVLVQPLLILDLNGILCHRRRAHKESKDTTLRPSIGTLALTPIIPRTDLNGLLRFLDQHFCLAVWTSAKRNTAKKLLNLLIPEDIRDRLLFVWGQNYCDAIKAATNAHGAGTTSGDVDDNVEEEDKEGDKDNVRGGDVGSISDNDDYDDGDGTVYEKPLRKVWKAFPLWSADNTLLVDDSPDKCRYAAANAIHPPPIHGQALESVSRVERASDAQPKLSDEENERQQRKFFEDLVQFWKEHPHLQSYKCLHKTKLHHIAGSREEISYEGYRNFLETRFNRHFDLFLD